MPHASVNVDVGALHVEIETDQVYPDGMTDLINRAAILVGSTIAQLKGADIDIMAIYNKNDYDDEDEDEDEEAEPA
jgi:hypothetical protein